MILQKYNSELLPIFYSIFVNNLQSRSADMENSYACPIVLGEFNIISNNYYWVDEEQLHCDKICLFSTMLDNRLFDSQRYLLLRDEYPFIDNN